MAIDIKSGISHLSHLEDALIENGIIGANNALKIVKEFSKGLTSEIGEPIKPSEKIDGMALYFGTDPYGNFFVGNKSVLNKKPKLNFSSSDIMMNHGSTGIGPILNNALNVIGKQYKQMGIKDGIVFQSDILWSEKSDKEIREIDGEKYITFLPNTVMYATPLNSKSDLSNKIKRSNFGLVVHGVYMSEYDGDRLVLNRLSTDNIRPLVNKIKNMGNVFITDTFVDDIEPLRDSQDEIGEINSIVNDTKRLIGEVDPDFAEEWESDTNKNIRKFKTMFSKFMSSQIKIHGEVDTFIDAREEKDYLKKFDKYFRDFIIKQNKENIKTLKTISGKEKSKQDTVDYINWMKEEKNNIHSFMRIYFRLYNIKQLIISIFDKMESKLGKTFVVDRRNDFDLIATKPEGYVLVKDDNMVKIVDRLRFTKNNMLYGKFVAEEHGMGPESIGNGKRIKVKNRFVDSVYEDVMGAIEAMEELGDGFTKEEEVERVKNTKDYIALYVGKFQPPTKAHEKVIKNLSKTFNKVLILISESGKYLNPELSEELIKGATLGNNVQVAIGPVRHAWGLNGKTVETRKDELKNIQDLFRLNEEDRKKYIVLATGQETASMEGGEDRYFTVRDDDRMFDVNSNEQPSEEKVTGLYGIPIRKSGGVKVGASQIRQAIQDGKFIRAKEEMMGDDENIKDKIITELQNKLKEEKEKVIETEETTFEEAINILLNL